MLNDEYNGQAFNVGGISHVNVKDIAEVVSKIIDPNLKPVFDDPKPGEASKHQPNRKRLPGELIDFILDNVDTTAKLGYTPKIDLEAGVRNEVAWLKETPNAWNYEPRVWNRSIFLQLLQSIYSNVFYLKREWRLPYNEDMDGFLRTEINYNVAAAL